MDGLEYMEASERRRRARLVSPAPAGLNAKRMEEGDGLGGAVDFAMCGKLLSANDDADGDCVLFKIPGCKERVMIVEVLEVSPDASNRRRVKPGEVLFGDGEGVNPDGRRWVTLTDGKCWRGRLTEPKYKWRIYTKAEYLAAVRERFGGTKAERMGDRIYQSVRRMERSDSSYERESPFIALLAEYVGMWCAAEFTKRCADDRLREYVKCSREVNFHIKEWASDNRELTVYDAEYGTLRRRYAEDNALFLFQQETAVRTALANAGVSDRVMESNIKGQCALFWFSVAAERYAALSAYIGLRQELTPHARAVNDIISANLRLVSPATVDVTVHAKVAVNGLLDTIKGCKEEWRAGL